MPDHGKSVVILMADDDPDDRLLTREALEEAGLTNKLYFVENGELLLDYLFQRGAYNAENAPRPGLILLDLNMPLMDGREALEEIKSHAILRKIPVVVLTTSKAEEDILLSYELGVSGYITKPVQFGAFIEVMRTLGRYWFEIVERPY